MKQTISRGIVVSMIAAILQARMGSTRLPGKVLKPILGKPMLQHSVERLKRATRIDTIVVATTDKPEDDAVAKLAESNGVRVYRGSELDVLDRYYRAAQEVGADTIVRVTADCPMIDPRVVDAVIERFQEKGVDYTWSDLKYPEGLDTEVFSFSALEIAAKEARLPSEREHVTFFIRNNKERFKIDEEWVRGGEVYGGGYHWSVDTPDDFAFATAVFEHFGHNEFGMHDVIELLQRMPSLCEINKGGTGWEGHKKSLREDEEWKKQHA